MFKKIISFFRWKKLSPLKISFIVMLLFGFYYLWVNVAGNVLKNDLLTSTDKNIVDSFLNLRKTQPTSNKVGLITVDAQSIKQIGRWPWSRFYLTNIIRTLNEHYNVAVIGFDIVFSEPDQSFVNLKNTLEPIPEILFDPLTKNLVLQQNDHDQKFVNEINFWSNIVMGYFFRNDLEESNLTKEQQESFAAAIEPMRINTVINLVENPATYKVHKAQYPEVNVFSDKMNANYKAGFFSITPDENDGVVRRIEAVYSFNSNFYPALPIKMYETYRKIQEPESDFMDINIAFQEGGMSYFTIGDDVFYTDEDGTMRINYRGPAQTIPHFSFLDVYNKTYPVEALQGKIVIIGVTELGVYDIRNTPVGGTYPGLEVQGTILDNLLQKDFLAENNLTRLISLLLIIVGTLLIGFTKQKFKSLAGDASVLVILAGLVAMNLYVLNEYQLVLSSSFPLASMGLTWVLALIHTTFAEGKDKRFIKSAFNQYLAPKVIDQLIADPSQLRLGGQRKELSILFTDLAGFSSISEQLDVNQLSTILNEYLTQMVEIILKHDGTVDKFEGDAIIAFWGAPIDSEVHARQACQALVEMQNVMVGYRESLQKRNLPALNMRAGLNTGVVMVGNFGSTQRMDYTVMGDSVNLAARLEGVNKAYGTYSIISENTLSQIDPKEFATRYLDEIQVVGKEEPIKIFELQNFTINQPQWQKELNERFEDAYADYRARKWRQSREKLLLLQQEFPHDAPCQIFIKRNENLLTNPPGDDWTGVHRLDAK